MSVEREVREVRDDRDDRDDLDEKLRSDIIYWQGVEREAEDCLRLAQETLPKLKARTLTCPVCGRAVASIHAGKKPREKHDACRRFSGYLAAALRALGEMVFDDTPASVDCRSRVRGDLIAVANRIPVRWQRPRDGRGRFVRAKS